MERKVFQFGLICLCLSMFSFACVVSMNEDTATSSKKLTAAQKKKLDLQHKNNCFNAFESYNSVCSDEQYGVLKTACRDEFYAKYEKCLKKEMGGCSSSLCLTPGKYTCSFNCSSGQQCNAGSCQDKPKPKPTCHGKMLTCVDSCYASGNLFSKAPCINQCANGYVQCHNNDYAKANVCLIPFMNCNTTCLSSSEIPSDPDKLACTKTCIPGFKTCAENQ